MAMVLDQYYPFATGPGSNVAEVQWRQMAQLWLPTGVVAGALSGLNEMVVAQRAAGANMSVDVATGWVWIQGEFGVLAGLANLGITGNASGNPRIDMVVARADFVNDRIELDVLAGTPAVTPAAPALTQNTVMWEIPLAEVAVAAGATSIVTANITDLRAIVSQVTAFNQTAFTVAMGTHEAVPAGTRLFWTDDYGNVFMGQNLLTEGDPTPSNNHRGVYDFAFFQNVLRLHINQLAMATVEDPCDISIVRYDAVAGEDAPYAGGDLANLTGLAAGTAVAQVRAMPALVPEGGTTATGGAQAPGIGATLNFRTAEICRVLDTALERYAIGMDFLFTLCAVGFGVENQAMLLRENGVLELRSALRFSGQGENLTVRSGTDGVSNSTTTFVSATGAFTAADVGQIGRAHV